MSNLEIRIYYEDTDSEGVVYYANYLKFLERGRTEFLRELGFDLEEIKNEFSLIFAVKSVYAEYMSPARLNDLILIKTQVKKYGKVSIEFDQMIYSGNDNKVLFRSLVKVVSLHSEKFKPLPLPIKILEKLNG